MSKLNYKILDSLSLGDFDENSELIPLMTSEDEEVIKNESLKRCFVEIVSILALITN